MGVFGFIGKLFLSGVLVAGGGLGVGYYIKKNPDLAQALMISYYQNKVEKTPLNETDRKLLLETKDYVHELMDSNKTPVKKLEDSILELNKTYERVNGYAKEAKIPAVNTYVGPQEMMCRIDYTTAGLTTMVITGDKQLPVRKTSKGALLVGERDYIQSAYQQDNEDALTERLGKYLGQDREKIVKMMDILNELGFGKKN